MQPTPTHSGVPLIRAQFATLGDALAYAAQGSAGCNFYDGRGQLQTVLSYRELHDQARELALRLAGLGLPRGARMALVASTGADFLRFFFACGFAGLVPVPLPAVIQLGGRQRYVEQLRGLLASSGAAAAWASDDFLLLLQEAAGDDIAHLGDSDYFWRQPPAGEATPMGPDDLAYLQYTSGSTRFPRGVMISNRAVMANLQGILGDGVAVQADDRYVSWLPYYHDMGLVGMVLGPMASQLSVDYLATRDFAMRPRLWLALLSRNQGTISFGPPFGYQLAARRARAKDLAGYDLSHWRVAGIGAEMVQPAVMRDFAERMAPCGFDATALLVCYGMAECSLAITFAPLEQTLAGDLIDLDRLADHGLAQPATDTSKQSREFASCGSPLPSLEVSVRDASGRPLPERIAGQVWVRGSSVMSGYLNDPAATADVLRDDGWLITGDLGYWLPGNGRKELVITGRSKDLLIVNGRNIWPQDLEYLAESEPQVRPGDASAFAVTGDDGNDLAVLVVQCRESDAARRASLCAAIRQAVQDDLGIRCLIELVPPHTLPRTSSGKLSRSRARQEFLQRGALAGLMAQQATPGATDVAEAQPRSATG